MAGQRLTGDGPSKLGICWDATTPIPSLEGPSPVRRWPAITMHDPSTLKQIERFDLPPWPNNLVM